MRRTYVTVVMLSFFVVGCKDDAGGKSADAAVTAKDGGETDAVNAPDGGGDVSAATMATATLQPTSALLAGDAGVSKAMGTVTFQQQGTSVLISIDVGSAIAGDHGVHIHAVGSCTDTTDDAGTTPAGGAGGHWNPAAMNHGHIVADGGMHHAGDLGNVTVAAGGGGNKMLTTAEWKVSDVVGKAVVVHAAADDLMTNPTGNSGARIACGVIQAN